MGLRTGLRWAAMAMFAVAGCGSDDNVSTGSAGAQTEAQPIGDAVSDAPVWVRDDGSVDVSKVPDLIPVQMCAPAEGDCLGYIDARFVYPELLPADAPINSELGYQPGPSPVTDASGVLVGYLVPDVGFVSKADFVEERHGMPEVLPG